jgi:hypothetical protein
MDRPGSSNNFTTVHYTSRNEVLLSGFHRNSVAIDNQRVAALQDGEVFVKVVACAVDPAVSWQVQKAIWLPSAPSNT